MKCEITIDLKNKMDIWVENIHLREGRAGVCVAHKGGFLAHNSITKDSFFGNISLNED